MAPPRPTTSSAPISLPTRWLAGLAVLFAVPWVIVGLLLYNGNLKTEPASERPASAADSNATQGPWGHLIKTPIIISPPLEYVPADWGRNGPAEWVFANASVDVVRSFLSSSGLSPEQITQLASHTRLEPRIGGVIINPPPSVVKSLSRDVRARLYSQLARDTRNFDQAQAFRFIGRTPAEWLDGSLMSPETRALVEPLIYQDGAFQYFADIESIRADITSPLERQYLAKTLLRNSTALVRLSVESQEQLDDVVGYWGIGGRRTDIRPLIESVAESNDSRLVDIVHLLPAFARDHLYRYPKIQTMDLTRPLLANCLWSSLNFFEDHPNEKYLDVAFALNALRTNYYMVEHGYQLGDIVALVDDEGDLFHVAVYLADGLLFTKNGTSPVAPWTIMSLDHLKDFYKRHAENPRVIYHRLNTF